MLPKLIQINIDDKDNRSVEYAIEKDSFDPNTGDRVEGEIKIDPAALSSRRAKMVEEIAKIDEMLQRINDNDFDEVRNGKQK